MDKERGEGGREERGGERRGGERGCLKYEANEMR
jgi:hypothetical protein